MLGSGRRGQSGSSQILSLRQCVRAAPLLSSNACSRESGNYTSFWSWQNNEQNRPAIIMCTDNVLPANAVVCTFCLWLLLCTPTSQPLIYHGRWWGTSPTMVKKIFRGPEKNVCQNQLSQIFTKIVKIAATST